MSNHPNWVTPAGSIGAFPSQVPMSFTFEATPELPATSIAYSVLSGTIPTGLSLNSETGVLSGTPATVGKDTTYNFAVRATDDFIDEQRILDRTFSMIISGVAIPEFTTPTGTILNSNEFRTKLPEVESTHPSELVTVN